MKKVKENKDENSYEDKFRAELYVPDIEQFKKLAETYVLDIDHLHGRSEKKGVEATVFVTERQIKALEGEKVSIKVYENVSEIGRQRQKEVSKGDRFEGGKIAPKGLGIKK